MDNVWEIKKLQADIKSIKMEIESLKVNCDSLAYAIELLAVGIPEARAAACTCATIIRKAIKNE